MKNEEFATAANIFSFFNSQFSFFLRTFAQQIKTSILHKR